MRRPDPPIERLVAAAIATVLFALVLAWLYTQPEPITGRVISVDIDGNVTD